MSKKQVKHFIVAVLALGVCIVGCIAMNNYNRVQKQIEEDESRKSEKAEKIVFQMESVDDIRGFAYVVNNETLMFLRDVDDVWVCSADTKANISKDTVEGMLEKFLQVKCDDIIEKPENLSQYGFDNPTNHIVLSFKDNTTKNFIIGAQNEFDTTKYYMMMGEDDNVYIIDLNIPTAFSKELKDVVEVEK